MESNDLQARIDQLEDELLRLRYKRSIRSSLLAWLLVLLLAAVFVALMLDLPIIRVQSDNMTPLLQEGDIVFATEQPVYQRGDVIAFYFNTRMLARRCIAFEGETVNIDQDGVITVDGMVLNEPYASGNSYARCDIELPYKVPEGSIFVLADERNAGLDSRSTALGCVLRDQIIGTVSLRIYPFSRIGAIR